MIKFREKLEISDIQNVRDLLAGTGFFDAAPDEIDVASNLVKLSVEDGNTIENYKVIIAEEYTDNGAKIFAGYVCFAKVPCSLCTFEIYWIAVNKSIQGKGIGQLLLKEVEKTAISNSANKIILYTAGREQYLPTQQFYEHNSFKKEAVIKDYYSIGDDCLIYSKEV